MAQEIPNAIHRAFILTTVFVILVRWDCWGNKISKPHTVTRHCGCVLMSLIPARPALPCSALPWALSRPLCPGSCFLMAGLCQLCQLDILDITSKSHSCDLWKETVPYVSQSGTHLPTPEYPGVATSWCFYTRKISELNLKANQQTKVPRTYSTVRY